MPMTNTIPSEDVAVLATIDPDAYAHGAQNSDYCDMGDFDQLMAVLMWGDSDTTTTFDFKLQEATTAGGAGVKDISGKAITQLASGSPEAGDKQAIINLRAEDLDIDNGFRFVRAVATVADSDSPASAVTADYGAILLGFGPRYGPAYDLDLASVAEIVN